MLRWPLLLLQRGGFSVHLVVTSGKVSVQRGYCNLKVHLEQLKRDLGSDVGMAVGDRKHLRQCTSHNAISSHSFTVQTSKGR